MGGKTRKPDLLDVSIELKMNARTMEKQACKLEAQEKQERKKILEAMNKGQMENAKIYAETVIRQRKEALNVRRFGVKMGALSAKIESAARTQQMSETMKNTIPVLNKAMKQMDSMGVSNLIPVLTSCYRLEPTSLTLRKFSKIWRSKQARLTQR